MKKAALFILLALLATIEQGNARHCVNFAGDQICIGETNPQDKPEEKRDLSKPIDKMI